MKQITNLALLLNFLACSYLPGQTGEYRYKRELQGISEEWHKITLPEELYKKTNPSLNDIRILGITADSDTVEAPYLLRLSGEKQTDRQASFNLLNTARNEKGFFFTFEIPGEQSVNQITLNFKQPNFDWLVMLEGSQSQEEWFTVLDDYRIMSIKNDQADFRFTQLVFPTSRYRFYRLRVKTRQELDLLSAHITLRDVQKGALRDYVINRMDVSENKKTKQTEIEISLPQVVPVRHLKIGIADAFDYHRPVTVHYPTDSFETEKGWKQRYVLLSSGILSSDGKNEFPFSNTLVQKLRILVYNDDNAPLTIDTVQIKGDIHELAVRFAERADYFLVYGSKNAPAPRYDIGHFSDKIPASVRALSLGKEELFSTENEKKAAPLFQNPVWLWGIMGIFILLLGWFSVRMMQKN